MLKAIRSLSRRAIRRSISQTPRTHLAVPKPLDNLRSGKQISIFRRQQDEQLHWLALQLYRSFPTT